MCFVGQEIDFDIKNAESTGYDISYHLTPCRNILVSAIVLMSFCKGLPNVAFGYVAKHRPNISIRTILVRYKMVFVFIQALPLRLYKKYTV